MNNSIFDLNHINAKFFNNMLSFVLFSVNVTFEIAERKKLLPKYIVLQ